MHFYNRLNVFFGEAQGFPILDAQRARSAFRGHTVPSAPTADAQRLFAPTAGTQCLPRLRRAHSAFRAYGGHTVPSAPTAFPTKANGEEFAFRSIFGSSMKASKNHNPTTCKK